MKPRSGPGARRARRENPASSQRGATMMSVTAVRRAARCALPLPGTVASARPNSSAFVQPVGYAVRRRAAAATAPPTQAPHARPNNLHRRQRPCSADATESRAVAQYVRRAAASRAQCLTRHNGKLVQHLGLRGFGSGSSWGLIKLSSPAARSRAIARP